MFKRLMMFCVSMFVVLAVQLPVSATNNKLINYQGKLTNIGGTALDGTYDVTFKLYTLSSGGTAVWGGETHTLQISGGLINVMLGSSASLDSIPFNTQYYLSIQVSGDTNELTRQPLSQAAYANGSMGDFDSHGRVIISTTGAPASPAITIAQEHTGIYQPGNSNSLAIETNGGVRFHVDNNGVPIAGSGGVQGADTAFGVSKSYAGKADLEVINYNTDPAAGARILLRTQGSQNVELGCLNSPYDATRPSWLSINQKYDAPLILKTNNTDRLAILGNGNIGINKTNPTTALDIHGALSVDYGIKNFYVESPTTGGGSIMLMPDTAGPSNIYYHIDSLRFIF